MLMPLGGSPNWELGIIISRVADPAGVCPDPIHEVNLDLDPTLEKSTYTDPIKSNFSFFIF